MPPFAQDTRLLEPPAITPSAPATLFVPYIPVWPEGLRECGICGFVAKESEFVKHSGWKCLRGSLIVGCIAAFFLFIALVGIATATLIK